MTANSADGPLTRAARQAHLHRETTESTVDVDLTLDGAGRAQVATGVGFYDHMLSSLARHALWDLTVTARGDTHVDAHHTVEDVAIVLGQALQTALGDKAGIVRFGHSLLPLDETLVACAVDLSGRAYCVHEGEPTGQEHVLIGGSYLGSLTGHVLSTLAHEAQLTLHMRVLAGRDPHHVVEAQFKALARALRQAAALDPAEVGVPSSKGVL